MADEEKLASLEEAGGSAFFLMRYVGLFRLADLGVKNDRHG